MPFEFTGAPPALLDSSGNTNNAGFKSFSQATRHTTPTPTPPADPDSYAPRWPSTSLSSGSTTPTPSQRPSASFGRTSSFGLAAPANSHSSFARDASLRASFGLSSTFGTVFSKSANATSFSKSANPGITSAAASSTGKTIREEPEEQDTLLSRALKRSAKSRPAIFGRAEVAADRVLRDVLPTSGANIPALLSALRNIETTSPEVAAFIRSLFAESVKTTDPQANVDGVKGAAVLDFTKEPDEPKKKNTAKTPKLTIFRRHSQIKQVEDELKGEFLNLKQIPSSQGAEVLSKYILDQFFRSPSLEPIERDIVESLDLADDPKGQAELANILILVEARVWWAEANYKEADAREAKATRRARHYQPSVVAALASDKKTAVLVKTKQISKAPRSERVVADNAAAESDSLPKGLRFLDLPAELRNWVYREQLAPCGYICLLTRDWHGGSLNNAEHFEDVASGADVSILCANKQIHKEARSVLYRENNLCCIGLISTALKPIIDPHILPDAALPLLASLTLICDHRPNENQGQHWYERVNWIQLQAMTSLKFLRICLVEREEQRNENLYKQFILKHIMERVPEDCQISFGPKEFYEHDSVEEIIEQSDQRAASRKVRWGDAFSVDGKLLESLAKDVKKKQGRKSGHKRDYRFAEKPVTKSLQELIAAGEVDPRIVLGGCQ